MRQVAKRRGRRTEAREDRSQRKKTNLLKAINARDAENFFLCLFFDMIFSPRYCFLRKSQSFIQVIVRNFFPTAGIAGFNCVWS